ncbi:unnamed protein product [Hydatigera taeniaeformis]|uniref:Uncharacterized protein n=1 Tax=Hydatigena taeniaeformis TaxID=6205 RepID=A0A0R3XAE9_HYDTA|nr:unnamed protein product [Hydatigera taeniaeformis]
MRPPPPQGSSVPQNDGVSNRTDCGASSCNYSREATFIPPSPALPSATATVASSSTSITVPYANDSWLRCGTKPISQHIVTTV